MKRFLKACAVALGLMAAPIAAEAQSVDYNSVATAYVTTTISQIVVFDSTMQQGGTFEFSVLAHNGGGRAGQSDTANVKIEFYTSGDALVTSANTSYSGNLPIPTAACGNPCIDPAVPWTTVSISQTLTAAQAATVAYVKVYMYGIDGSYWAGDYGPWYRIPTLTLNGGNNLVYNPEFGPYNGVTAQGWTTSPAFGACQGAWGGSNACIVDASGVPGQSTTGLVANANGGGPDANGGTLSGTAGGYSSTVSTTTMASVFNGGPTLVSTTTTNQTKTVIVGNQSQTITTPVTVKTYSDGSTVTTNGTATTTVNSTTAFTGVHFGPNQVADTQWNVYACTQTNSCQIYSTLPGVTYNTQSPTTIGANQYITFIPNTGADSASYPWLMILVNSDGTYTSLGSCKVDVQGVDSNGYIYLFVQNASMNGTLFSANLGLTGQGMTFTGIMNPTMADTNTAAANMSSTPLAAGQTGGTVVPPGPQAVNVAAGNTGTNPAGTTTLDVTNAGTYTNNGTNGNVNNSGTFTNNGTTVDVTNSGDFTNNSGATVGAVANLTGGTFTNSGTTGAVTNDGTFTNNSGGVVGAVVNNASGVFNNSGTTGDVTNAGTFTNNAGGVTGAVSNSGTFTNNGTTGAFDNSGTLTNGGTIASLTNTGTATNSGTITGTVTNTSGTFTNSGTTGDWTNSATVNNSGTMGNGTNNATATFTNDGTVGTVNNAGTFANDAAGITGAFVNSGTVNNAGTIASLTNSGTAGNSGTVTGSVTNTGTFTNSGTTGAINNSATVNNSGTTGTVNNTGTFTNLLNSISDWITNSGTFSNAGVVSGVNNTGNMTNTGTVTGTVTNTAGTFINSGSTGNVTNAAGFANSGTTGTVNNSGTVVNTGTTGAVTNTGTFATSGTVASVNNSGTLVMTGGSAGAITNSGTFGYTGGTLHSVTNTGVFDITGAGASVAMTGYTQTATGTSIMRIAPAGAQVMQVSGAATLGGTLQLNAAAGPYHIGYLDLMSAGSVSGRYSSLVITPNTVAPLGPKLFYSSTGVRLGITPSATHTQSSIDAAAGGVKTMNGTQSGLLGSGLGNDCPSGGPNGGCVSVNLGRSPVGTGELSTGGTTITKSINDNWRIGMFVDQALNTVKSSTASQTYNPTVGGMIGWKQNADGMGLGITGSMVQNKGTMTINRPATAYSEAGTGRSVVEGKAAQVKMSYSIRISPNTVVTPYAGFRRTQLSSSGYTETGNTFPLTVNGSKQTTDTGFAGASVAHKLTDKLTVTGSAGVSKTLANKNSGINGSSDILNMENWSASKQRSKSSSVGLGVGLNYEIIPGHYVGVNAGWSQKSLTSAGGASVGISYGFSF